MSLDQPYSAAALKSTFRRIDWDFAGAWTRYGLSPLHWYPVQLTPQVASSLISALTRKNDIVCDPFCGSGTVLAEAMRLGRRAIGIDINPVACLIARARTTLIPLRQLVAGNRGFLERLHFGTNVLRGTVLPLPLSRLQEEGYALTQALSTPIPNPDLAQWFHPDVYRDLCLATQCVSVEANPEIKTLLTVLISSVLRTSAGQSKSWRNIADNVIPKRHVSKDIYGDCAQRLGGIERGMQIFIEQCAATGLDVCSANKLVTVESGDARQVDAVRPRSIDCVVTSPPSPNSTDYLAAHRLSLLWLGHNLETLKEAEIGARRRRFSSQAIDTYLGDMRQSLLAIHRILKPGGRFAIVLRSAPPETTLSDIPAVLAGFIVDDLRMKLIATFTREARSIHGRLRRGCELVLIYRKRS